MLTSAKTAEQGTANQNSEVRGQKSEHTLCPLSGQNSEYRGQKPEIKS